MIVVDTNLVTVDKEVLDQFPEVAVSLEAFIVS